MTELTIYGPAPSSYVRTARLVCEEKGVSYTLKPVDLGTEAHQALHPFKKVPVLEHGDVRIFETAAIAHYINDSFDGPSLVPSSPLARAQMEQWISSLDCYLYDSMIKRYALQYIFPRGANGAPDRAVIDAAVPEMTHGLDLLNSALEGRPWLAGQTLSLADLFVAPVIATIKNFPEAKALVAQRSQLARLQEAVEGRPSWPKVQPPPPQG